MFKIVLAFLFVFGLFFFGIKAFRNITEKEKWALAKLVGYSLLCTLMAIVLLVLIVVLF
jgi:hypothetical protein